MLHSTPLPTLLLTLPAPPSPFPTRDVSFDQMQRDREREDSFDSTRARTTTTAVVVALPSGCGAVPRSAKDKDSLALLRANYLVPNHTWHRDRYLAERKPHMIINISTSPLTSTSTSLLSTQSPLRRLVLQTTFNFFNDDERRRASTPLCPPK